MKVLLPRNRVGGHRTFSFDAVSAYMQVMPGGELPLLGVYKVYSVLSGDLSMPFQVTE